MTRDELEFLISQYLDGSLEDEQRRALEQRFETDAEARQLLAEYRTLDEALRVMPAPQVQWDHLHKHLSSAIDDAELPVRTYKIDFRRRLTTFALAASVLIALSFAVRFYMTGTISLVEPALHGVAIVEGPAPQAPAGEPVASISIGPAPQADLSRYHLSEQLVYRPSRVSLIASGAQPMQDNPLPF